MTLLEARVLATPAHTVTRRSPHRRHCTWQDVAVARHDGVPRPAAARPQALQPEVELHGLREPGALEVVHQQHLLAVVSPGGLEEGHELLLLLRGEAQLEHGVQLAQLLGPAVEHRQQVGGPP